MSVYDPFRLYTHHQKKSHDGQVIRKKLIPPQNYAISEEMLKQAQEILIKAGIRGFNSSSTKRLFQFKQYTDIEEINFQIPPGQSSSNFQFSNFWDAIKGDFAPIYNTVSPLSVINISFIINLNSVTFGPTIQSSDSQQSTVWTRFEFQGYLTPSGTYGPTLGRGRLNLSCTSYSQTNWLRESDVPQGSDGGGFVQKQTPTSHNFLTSITNNSPAILTVLKNSDYTVFNPNLFGVYFDNVSAETTFTISNVIYNLTVELAVEYK